MFVDMLTSALASEMFVNGLAGASMGFLFVNAMIFMLLALGGAVLALRLALPTVTGLLYRRTADPRQQARDDALAQLDAELMRYLVDLGNRPPRIIDLV